MAAMRMIGTVLRGVVRQYRPRSRRGVTTVVVPPPPYG